MLQIARIDPMEPSTVISNPASTSWVVVPSNCINPQVEIPEIIKRMQNEVLLDEANHIYQ
ncbi:hypothetical protein JG687_00011727 [Phytophthora cactorum]|uniref:Uncharacterized protein n=1 Tax=Phytophthora cactorum TaxID=29920 RepID=A0A8T1U908_9STRA|nr:hypothetical protein GQ600_11766 [Phytophthora cactorum]KAG6954602.1 hypothetical protein JG687_00011727 [Phytophthora cactorum]